MEDGSASQAGKGKRGNASKRNKTTEAEKKQK